MLSDEEKKAIKNIKKEFEKNHILPDIANEDLGTLLNLIEKQSKEIEELKEKNKNLNWYFKNQKDNFVHKDKIKAKIEELENQKKQWIEDRDNKHKDSEIIYAIEVLQSLLEKE